MTIFDILDRVSTTFGFIIPILLLLSTAFFLYGITRYITAGGDESQTQEARTYIVYSIIFMAVMVAVWGLVLVLINFVFGVNPIPNIPGPDIVDTI